MKIIQAVLSAVVISQVAEASKVARLRGEESTQHEVSYIAGKLNARYGRHTARKGARENTRFERTMSMSMDYYDYDFDYDDDCREGEVLCDEDPRGCDADESCAKFSDDECCDFATQDECYDNVANEFFCAEKGGCVLCAEGETKCNEDHEGGVDEFCVDLEVDVCCDFATEEECYDNDTHTFSCAAIETGGCVCAEGETKCGADLTCGYPGHCTDSCCDDDTEDCPSNAGRISFPFKPSKVSRRN